MPADNPVERWLEAYSGDETPVPTTDDFVAFVQRAKRLLGEQSYELRKAVRLIDQIKTENTRLRAALDAALRAP